MPVATRTSLFSGRGNRTPSPTAGSTKNPARASLRAQLGLKPGAKFTVRTQDEGRADLVTFAAAARSAMGMYAHLAPEGVSLVDELIAERRAEAARE